LAEFDETAVASRLYTAFDFLFFGHTHYSYPEMRTTPVGTSIMSRSGCLYQSRSYFNGYQIIRIDIAAGVAEFLIRTYYDKPRRGFDKALHIADEGSLSLPFISQSSKPSLTRIERVLRIARPVIRQIAAEQINVPENPAAAQVDVKDVFVCPPLRSGRLGSLPAVANEPPEDKEISVEQLLRDPGNVIVTGAREAGKSSLGHYMTVLCAEGICDRPRVPVFIDYRHLRRPSTYELKRAITTYIGSAVGNVDLDTALNDGDFLFLVDNWVPKTPTERLEFISVVRAQPLCRWVCLTDAAASLIDEEPLDAKSKGFRVVCIEQLPRRSIRELSRRWTRQIGSDGDTIFATIMHQLERDKSMI
jgi:hypothetical protein